MVFLCLLEWWRLLPPVAGGAFFLGALENMPVIEPNNPGAGVTGEEGGVGGTGVVGVLIYYIR
jgi:hypothetical protein